VKMQEKRKITMEDLGDRQIFNLKNPD